MLVFFLIGIFLLLMIGSSGKVIRYGILKLLLEIIAYFSIPLVILIGCFYRG